MSPPLAGGDKGEKETLMMKQKFLKTLALAAAVLLGLVSAHATANTTTPEKQAAKALVQPDPMAEKWGIEVTSIRMTAHNHMVDFRYRVLDVAKAESLFNKATKPNLIHQATGKVLAVPNTAKVGPLRSSYKPQKDRIYWMFFGNAGGLVKAGDKVTVVIGEFRAENLTVQ
jgi:hypothetical protein